MALSGTVGASKVNTGNTIQTKGSNVSKTA